MRGSLRLADLLGGLSIVADLGFGLPREEAMRACLIGTALAREIGATEEEVADTFYASLLVHVGCTASRTRRPPCSATSFRTQARWRERTRGSTGRANAVRPGCDPWDEPDDASEGSGFHRGRGKAFGKRYETASCEVARATSRRIGLGSGVQRAAYEGHEWWSGGGAPRGIAGEEIALAARVARVAAEAARFSEIGGTELAIDAVRRRSGGVLDPSIAQVFVTNAPALVAEAGAGDPRERILEVEPEPVALREQAELCEVAAAFGDLADLKMPFTHGHSREVARLATAAASGCGSTPRRCRVWRWRRCCTTSGVSASPTRSGRSLRR